MIEAPVATSLAPGSVSRAREPGIGTSSGGFFKADAIPALPRRGRNSTDDRHRDFRNVLHQCRRTPADSATSRAVPYRAQRGPHCADRRLASRPLRGLRAVYAGRDRGYLSFRSARARPRDAGWPADHRGHRPRGLFLAAGTSMTGFVGPFHGRSARTRWRERRDTAHEATRFAQRAPLSRS